MRKKRLFVLAALVSSMLTVSAQTANNDPVKVTWALTTGDLETGVCEPGTQNQFITPGAMTIGSGITITAESSSEPFSIQPLLG